MKYIALIFLIFYSCSKNVNSELSRHSCFYEKIIIEEKTYENFLKHKGLREILQTLNNELCNTNKVILISDSDEFISAFFIYDSSNNRHFYAWKKYKEQEYSYKKLTESDLIEIKGKINLFVLKYVLESKIEELKKISLEAFDTSLGQYKDVHVLDVENHVYEFTRFRSFDVYKGKPVMNEEEYLESIGIKKAKPLSTNQNMLN